MLKNIVTKRIPGILAGNRGFTLLEVVVALSLMGFVTTGLAFTINTIFSTSNLAVTETVSLRQVQNAGFWITKDIQRAKSSTVSAVVAGRFLDLECYTGSSSTGTSHIWYIITEGTMTRYSSDGSTMSIAQNIIGVGTQTTMSTDNATGTLEWVFNIAVSNGEDNSRTGTYRATPRVQ